MHPEKRAFVEAIRASMDVHDETPVGEDDLTLKLVFADWLEENGEEKRAAWLRIAARPCETPGRFGEICAYNTAHRGNEMCGPCEANYESSTWELGLPAVTFQSRLMHVYRGFVVSVRCRLQTWFDFGAALYENHPVCHVSVDDEDIITHVREYGGGDDRMTIYRVHYSEEFWSCLCPANDANPGRYSFYEVWDIETAREVFSRACLLWAKRKLEGDL